MTDFGLVRLADEADKQSAASLWDETAAGPLRRDQPNQERRGGLDDRLKK